MSAADVEVVARFQEALPTEELVTPLTDEAGDQQLSALLEPLVEPDFETVMLGPEYIAAEVHEKGIEGFRAAWHDWTSPFESYEIEVEDVVDAPRGVLTLVTQRGVTKTGGIEIEETAAAVWMVRNGKIARVEFHLDQDVARRAAGLSEEPTNS